MGSSVKPINAQMIYANFFLRIFLNQHEYWSMQRVFFRRLINRYHTNGVGHHFSILLNELKIRRILSRTQSDLPTDRSAFKDNSNFIT